MNYLETIAHAIQENHGLSAHYLESVSIVEEFHGKVLWNGQVEVFEVDHPIASRCYAWAEPCSLTVTSVLGIPSF